MKKFCILCMCLALAGFVSCQKQQTEEERKAEIDRQVEQRLAAERQAQEKESLAQRAAELDAREKALSEQQKADAATPTPRPRGDSVARSTRSEDGPDYNMFYTKLDRYGDWRETADYGYVWQPREAERSRNWHPYTEGRWVYTDVGWTWVSDEPFGWATYHYGRWARLRGVGWVWVPGDEWAPAWVSWRKSNDYVGWAPLPPEARFDRRRGIQNWSDNYYDIGPDQYRFVATREFGSRQIGRTVVPREQNVTIINQTTNVTNITYSNTVVVNQGPNYEELRTRSQQPIERLRLERNVNVDLNVDVAGPVVRGEVIAIPAPVIAVGRPVQRPRTVKAAIAQTIVEHGWEDISDKQAAEKARTKMKSESTPPPDAPPKTFVKPAVAAETPATASAASAATASPSPIATATATASATAAVSPTVAPKQTATASPTATPQLSVSPTATQAGVSKPVQTFAPAATATATQSPVTGTPARRITTLPSPTVSPTVSPSASSTASPTASPTISGATQTPGVAGAKTTPRRPVPSGFVPVPAPSPTAGEPEEPPKVGGKLKSQAKKFVPPGDVPMRSPGAPTAAPTSTAVASPASTPAGQPAMTPLPSPTASPTAGSPSPESKHKHDGGKRTKPGESGSPTATPTPTPTPAAE